MGLEDALTLSLAGPTHDARSWNYSGMYPDNRDPVLGIERLQDAYFARVPDYPKGITVPAIVDVPSGAVVTNDFNQMTIDMCTQWSGVQRDGAADLYPESLVDEIEAVNDEVYPNINNGVYRCGLAADQSSYEDAYRDLWRAMDWVSDRLTSRRYLVGDHITLADVRLFTTLVRFDAVYFGHFKANRMMIRDMPVLRAYLQDLFQTPGFGDTVDIQQIKEHYYIVHEEINPTRVVPVGPDLSYLLEEHDREQLGDQPFGQGTAPGPVREDERPPALTEC